VTDALTEEVTRVLVRLAADVRRNNEVVKQLSIITKPDKYMRRAVWALAGGQVILATVHLAVLL